MLHPIIIKANGQIRYDQLRQEAEIERSYRRISRDHPRLQARIGALLIRLGERLQAQPHSPAYRLH